MPYLLNAIHLDCSSGIVKASVNVSSVDALTGATGGFDRIVSLVPPAVQTRLDAIAADAIAYLNAQHPGLNLTLPPGGV